MIEVTVEEFRNNLEKYIQKVRKGSTVVILENGKAKAKFITMRSAVFPKNAEDSYKREYEEGNQETTQAEFIKNLNSYLQEAESGKSVIIVEKEKEVARLIAMDSFDFVRSIMSPVETDYTDEEIKEIIRAEWIKKYESID